MKIITAQYHQLAELHHKVGVQDLHQHQSQRKNENLNSSDPTHNRGKINRVNSFESAKSKTKMSKGGPFKSTGTKGHPTPSGSNQMPSHRPQLICTACGGSDHLRKDCCEDVFCNNCRTRSHATEMCRAASHQATGNIICIYCGSVNHTLGKCQSKPNDNREEPRSTPRDLREQGPRINYSRMGHQPQVSHHQTRFNEGLKQAVLTKLYKSLSVNARICSRSGP